MIEFVELMNRYDAFLLDAYGVFWGSHEVGVYPGAREAMAALVASGKQVGILSNSSQIAATEREKFAKHGLLQGVHYHFLVTSGEVAAQLFANGRLPFAAPRKTYFLSGDPVPLSGYSQVATLEEADFVYIGVPRLKGQDQENLSVFEGHMEEMARVTLPILCANPDRYATEGNPPRLVVRQGMIADLLEERGATVFRIGKPYPLVYEEALRLLVPPISPDRVVMIGDTPETDIRGARALGLGTVLVLQTGIFSKRLNDCPTSLTELPATDVPDYTLERFSAAP